MSTEEVQEIKAKIDESYADELRETYLQKISHGIFLILMSTVKLYDLDVGKS